MSNLSIFLILIGVVIVVFSLYLGKRETKTPTYKKPGKPISITDVKRRKRVKR